MDRTSIKASATSVRSKMCSRSSVEKLCEVDEDLVSIMLRFLSQTSILMNMANHRVQGVKTVLKRRVEVQALEAAKKAEQEEGMTNKEE